MTWGPSSGLSLRLASLATPEILFRAEPNPNQAQAGHQLEVQKSRNNRLKHLSYGGTCAPRVTSGQSKPLCLLQALLSKDWDNPVGLVL